MIIIINVVKTIMNHPPVITIFIDGMVTSPSHGWSIFIMFSTLLMYEWNRIDILPMAY